jgi:hypothetical protein
MAAIGADRGILPDVAAELAPEDVIDARIATT